MVPLILAVIHSIFGIQFAIAILEGIASKEDLLPSIIATVVVIGSIYGAYFMATYFGSKNIIKEWYKNEDRFYNWKICSITQTDINI